jgi:hypothetical protein
MNNLYKRPMFRKGGSAEGGITSGLQRPGYASKGRVEESDLSNVNLRDMNMQQIKDLSNSFYPERPRPNYAKRRIGDAMIDFGIDIASRTPIGSGIGGAISTTLAAAKEPFANYRATRAVDNAAMDKRDENLIDRRSDMFGTLLGAQADIQGSDGVAKTYKDQWVADKLEAIVPELFQLKKKDPATLTEEEQIRLETLLLQKNNLTKSNPVTEGAIDIFVKSSKGQTIFMEISEKLYKGNPGNYDGENDPQLIRDAIEEVKKILGAFSGGGRAGYANGEMVEEQVTETETMAPGPMAQSDNPISYDQLRARLPNEITDDIVELMANSAEALEDFAMISSQQDVDLFNQKYSVNLVLPSGA